MSWGTVTLLELLWTLVGVTGLIISFLNLRDAHGDYILACASGTNGALRAVARSEMREEALRHMKCIVITFAGVAAMVTPPANAHQPVSPLQVIVASAVFLLGVLIVYGSLAARSARHRTQQMIRKHLPAS